MARMAPGKSVWSYSIRAGLPPAISGKAFWAGARVIAAGSAARAGAAMERAAAKARAETAVRIMSIPVSARVRPLRLVAYPRRATSPAVRGRRGPFFLTRETGEVARGEAA
jgi:hypothetical protein